jgi:flagellar M-ring protein FliF
VDIITREDQENAWRRDWSTFGTPQFVAFGLLAVAVLILGFWFLRWSTAPTWSIAASGLSATEAADASAELDAAGIENRLANGGAGIEVPSAAADRAAVVLGDSGVIGNAAEGYEILDRQGFTTSSFKQRIDYQRAVEGELAQTIMAMETIDTATVHLAIPEQTVFSDAELLTRASVVVSGNADQGTVASIINIVGSSVPGLDPANVTVADTSGRILSGLDDTGFGNSQQLGMQDLYESQLEMNAETMLATALGPGKAVVRVSADLNFDETESESLSYDRLLEGEEPVVLRQQIVDEYFTGEAGVPRGVLGVDDVDIDQVAGGDGGSYLREEDGSEFGVDSTRTVRREAPGQLERLTVAVLVDANLENAPTDEELEALVGAAVGLDVDGRQDEIIVQTIAFDTTATEEAEALAAETAAAGEGGGGMVGTIVGYLKTAVAVIGIILALLFLRKGLRPLLATRDEAAELPAGETPNALGAGVIDDATRQVPVVTVDESNALLGAGGASLLEAGPDAASTVDMLQLIDQQPDEVADLLRGWMAEAN